MKNAFISIMVTAIIVCTIRETCLNLNLSYTASVAGGEQINSISFSEMIVDRNKWKSYVSRFLLYYACGHFYMYKWEVHCLRCH